MKIDKNLSYALKRSAKARSTLQNHKEASVPLRFSRNAGFFEELHIKSSRLKGELPLLEPKKHIPPLISVLNILSGILEEGQTAKADFLLIENFLNKWVEKYKEKTPGKILKPMKEIINSLKYLHSHQKSDETMDLYALQGRSHDGGVRWSIQMKEESLEKNGPSDDEISCKLEVASDLLGKIQAVLFQDSGQYGCVFSSDSDKTNKAIRERLGEFRDQLEKRGVELPQIQIRSLKKEIPVERKIVENEVDIWT